MKTILLISFLSLSLTALAQDKVEGASLKCTPNLSNAYFTGLVKLKILPGAIKVDGVKLKYDNSYTGKGDNAKFSRYKGNTEAASGWSDSGTVEIFYNGTDKVLSFRVRGETYIQESFSCR